MVVMIVIIRKNRYFSYDWINIITGMNKNEHKQ